MNAYIVREAAIPFFSLLLLGVALLVVNRLLKVLPWLFEFNIPLFEIGGVLLFLVPSFLIYALPIAMWVGWLVGYGRLGADGELSAFASVGTTPVAMLRPGMWIGLLFFLSALAVCEWGYGQGRLQFQYGMVNLARQAAGQSLKPGSIAQLSDQVWLAVPEQEGDGDPPVFIIKDPDMVMAVNSATPSEDFSGFELGSGIAYLRNATTPVVAAFESGIATLDALQAQNVYAGIRERTMTQLWKGRTEPGFRMEFHQRFALSFALLLAPAAAFVAAPRRTRSARGQSVLISLAGFVIYYGLFTAGKQAALKSVVPVEIGMWAGNLFLLVATIWVMQRKVRLPGIP